MESIRTKSARCEFTANRDDAGVPHVVANNWLEALYALGFLHATDRPTQIFFARAVASGRAAERIANTDEMFETDQFFRRAGLHLQLDEEVEILPDDVREQLDWYCRGVNDGLENAGRTLPMWVTGFQPQPWDPAAVLLIGNLLSFAGLAVGTQENERLLLELVQLGIDEQRLRELFEPYLDDADFENLKQVHIARRLSDDALELLADLPRLAGSNAWAVSPQRSATGTALLAGDPHLEVNRLPAIWYEVVLQWGDDHYAMGATLPGCPLMAVGRTRQLAWSVTYLHADTSDFFVEDCRPGGETGWQYRRGDSWHDFGTRDEEILRKGSDSETIQVLENDLGTLTRTPESDEPGKYLSASWIGQQFGGGLAINSWLSMFAADNVRVAMEAVSQSPHPTLVWVFADRDGHIGRQASGWLPHRGSQVSGLIPVAAWDIDNHWRGRQPREKLPNLYDPPEGYLASANEDLNRAGQRLLNTVALPDYRKRRIISRLSELPAASVADMQALQYDVVSVQAQDLLPLFLPHIPPGPFKDKLSAWDCRYEPDAVEPTMFQNLYRHVLLEIFGHEEGIGWRRMFYLCTRLGFSMMVLTAIDRTLRKTNSSWWVKRDKGEMIRAAALRAAEESAAPWSEVNSFHFVNRFFEKSRVGRLLGFRTAQMPMRGCHATPFQGHLLTTATRESTFAPSYHFVTDLGTDEAWSNLPGGASESRFSKWYRSDIERWRQGEYKKLEIGL